MRLKGGWGGCRAAVLRCRSKRGSWRRNKRLGNQAWTVQRGWARRCGRANGTGQSVTYRGPTQRKSFSSRKNCKREASMSGMSRSLCLSYTGRNDGSSLRSNRRNLRSILRDYLRMRCPCRVPVVARQSTPVEATDRMHAGPTP